VFLTDPNGGVYTAAGNPDAGWGPWQYLPGSSAVPGSPVSVVALPNNEFAIFVAGPDGTVAGVRGKPEAGFWTPWFHPSDGKTIPGARITAAPMPWPGVSLIALVLADPAGGVYATVGIIDDGPKAWDTWGSVSQGQTLAGGTVSAAPLQHRLAVFLSDPQGGVFVATSRFDPPLAPTDLRVTNITANSISVSWSAVRNAQDNFRVEYTGSNSTGQTVNGDVSVGADARTATFTNLLSGYLYTITATASNAAGRSPKSNPVTATTPVQSQVVSTDLFRVIVDQGFVPYSGQYPAFGVALAGHVISITVPPSFGTAGLSFVKIGHSTEECGDPNAVVSIPVGATTTPSQMAAIFNTERPPFSTLNPLQFVACHLTNSNQDPDRVPIQLTIVTDGP